MSEPAVYVTSPSTGKVHLIDFAVMMGEPEEAETLCGQPVYTNWVDGDETMSGVATTCGSCLRIFRPDLDNRGRRALLATAES
jgi:hypothetical protein